MTGLRTKYFSHFPSWPCTYQWEKWPEKDEEGAKTFKNFVRQVPLVVFFFCPTFHYIVLLYSLRYTASLLSKWTFPSTIAPNGLPLVSPSQPAGSRALVKVVGHERNMDYFSYRTGSSFVFDSRPNRWIVYLGTGVLTRFLVYRLTLGAGTDIRWMWNGVFVTCIDICHGRRPRCAESDVVGVAFQLDVSLLVNNIFIQLVSLTWFFYTENGTSYGQGPSFWGRGPSCGSTRTDKTPMSLSVWPTRNELTKTRFYRYILAGPSAR